MKQKRPQAGIKPEPPARTWSLQRGPGPHQVSHQAASDILTQYTIQHSTSPSYVVLGYFLVSLFMSLL